MIKYIFLNVDELAYVFDITIFSHSPRDSGCIWGNYWNEVFTEYNIKLNDNEK